MLCDLPTVQQAAIGDCLSFDPFPFDSKALAQGQGMARGAQQPQARQTLFLTLATSSANSAEIPSSMLFDEHR
jgi:hypothetical protein